MRDDALVATVCGVVERVNKLITVKTLHRRYGAEVGDVVVGRVTEVCLIPGDLDVSMRWTGIWNLIVCILMCRLEGRGGG